MFDFMKNAEKIVSPVSGKCIRIEEVNDKVFSSKIIGDGFAIIPDDNEVVSPVTGKIITAADTKHAVAIRTKKGEDILLHIGIDTVALNGEGFEIFVGTGSTVKAGDCMFKFDNSFMQEKGIDVTVMVIFASEGAKNIRDDYYDKTVLAGEVLARRD